MPAATDIRHPPDPHTGRGRLPLPLGSPPPHRDPLLVLCRHLRRPRRHHPQRVDAVYGRGEPDRQVCQAFVLRYALSRGEYTATHTQPRCTDSRLPWLNPTSPNPADPHPTTPTLLPYCLLAPRPTPRPTQVNSATERLAAKAKEAEKAESPLEKKKRAAAAQQARARANQPTHL